MKNLPKIGKWQVDAPANELRRGGESVRLTPKAMQVLSAFLDQRGEVLTREQLTDHANCSDESLSRLVSEIRDALGDDARRPEFLETIPRRGYRLIPAVAVGDDTDSEVSVVRWRTPVIAAVVVTAIVALIWLLYPAPEAVGSNHVMSRATRLTPADGVALLPRIVQGGADYLSTDSSDVRHTLKHVAFESLSTHSVGKPGALQRLAADGSTEFVSVYSRDGGCRVEKPGTEAVSCRYAMGGLDVSPGEVYFEHPDGGIGAHHWASGRSRLLTTPDKGQNDSAPRLSANGRLAFIRGDDVRSELFLIETGESAATALTDDHQAVFDFDWLDDRHLVVASDRSGTRQLWALDSFSGQWTNLHQPDIWHLDYRAPDLVFERPVFRADIIRHDGRQSAPVVVSARYDNHPIVSPDGKHLAFVSMRSGSPSLWVSDIDGNKAELLVSQAGGRITRPVWKDADTIAFLIYSGNRSQLATIGLDRQSLDVPTAGVDAREVAFAGDEQQLFLIGAQGDRSGLFRMVDGQAELVLSGQFQRLVADGSALYVSAPDSPLLTRYDAVSGHSDSAFLLDGDRELGLHWSVTNNKLLYSDGDQLWRQPLEGGTRELIPTPPPSTIGLGLAVNPLNDDVYTAVFQGREVALYHMRLEVVDDG